MGRRKCVFSEKLVKDFPFLKKGNDIHHAVCSVCVCEISIANKGRLDITDHLKTEKHKKNVNLLPRLVFVTNSNGDQEVISTAMTQKQKFTPLNDVQNKKSNPVKLEIDEVQITTRYCEDCCPNDDLLTSLDGDSSDLSKCAIVNPSALTCEEHRQTKLHLTDSQIEDELKAPDNKEEMVCECDTTADYDKMFLLALLPAYKRLKPDDKLEAQMEILRCINSKLRNS